MQFVKRLGVSGFLLVQRMFDCVPEKANGVDQIAKRGLPFSDCFSHRIEDQTALRVDSFLSRGRQIDADRVFDHPADLLQVLPGTPP
jgi:hypothetical protein